jgi:hypothetical protein
LEKTMDNQEKADTPPEAPQETPAPEAAATEDSAQGTPKKALI